ncbi:MAG: hypothetical protein DLM73_01740 [Chthoniobacterales bacterium]|nr:MAG: hypothetical protein DLM73_01740 [Chthoniobacterales bacterium]
MGMKWLAAGLTFVNASTVGALGMGMMARGLTKPVAIVSVLLGLMTAAAAWLTTPGDPARPKPPESSEPPTEFTSKRARARALRNQRAPVVIPPAQRYRSIWFWLLAACFAIFAFRSFCWLLYLDGNELKVQSPNNLGDLSLHLTYIKTFANGVPLWPDNPIYVFSKLRYPAGIDLFNGLLTCLGLDVTRGLVWTGLLASAATCYALYRWAGSFGIAAFLFNGGVASYLIFQTHQFLDYQGANTVAWKSIPLAMFVTQRGLLYALPAGFLLLYQWRMKFFQEAVVSKPPEEREEAGGLETVAPSQNPPLPFWVELSLYATMPLFHVHTFMALSIVLVFLFLFTNNAARLQLGFLVSGAFLPATFCVWVISDHFRAGSVMEWKPGWVQQQGDFAMNFLQFWLFNFGAWVPLVTFFIGITALSVWNGCQSADYKIPARVAFLIPAGAIFLLGYLVKTAPWEWDNIKIIVWAYFIILPFLWSDLIARWPWSMRAVVCLALFASGFVTLFGGLIAGKEGFGLADRAELDFVGAALRKLPADARYAGFPTYNHPVLLQGRKMVLGYPGHLWTQGFNYSQDNDKLTALMKGEPGWKETARFFHTRYLFWGREEKTNYPQSKRPWERESKLIAAGTWGAIYDLEAPSDQALPRPASPSGH